jgi:hypothetical protein
MSLLPRVEKVCGNPCGAAVTEHLNPFEGAGNAFILRMAAPNSFSVRL